MHDFIFNIRGVIEENNANLRLQAFPEVMGLTTGQNMLRDVWICSDRIQHALRNLSRN